jgi:hypothetical protein
MASTRQSAEDLKLHQAQSRDASQKVRDGLAAYAPGHRSCAVVAAPGERRRCCHTAAGAAAAVSHMGCRRCCRQGSAAAGPAQSLAGNTSAVRPLAAEVSTRCRAEVPVLSGVTACM